MERRTLLTISLVGESQSAFSELLSAYTIQKIPRKRIQQLAPVANVKIELRKNREDGKTR